MGRVPVGYAAGISTVSGRADRRHLLGVWRFLNRLGVSGFPPILRGQSIEDGSEHRGSLKGPQATLGGRTRRRAGVIQHREHAVPTEYFSQGSIGATATNDHEYPCSTATYRVPISKRGGLSVLSGYTAKTRSFPITNTFYGTKDRIQKDYGCPAASCCSS